MPHTDSIELVGSIVVARMARIGATSSLGRFLVKDRSPPDPALQSAAVKGCLEHRPSLNPVGAYRMIRSAWPELVST
jgi:hypothetical protein